MHMKTTLSALAATALAGTALAAPLTHVPAANPKTPGFVAPNILSPELDQRLIATGSMNLDGANATTQYYGYIAAGAIAPMLPVLGNTTAPTLPLVEAGKSEPDKNLYLVFEPKRGYTQQRGADASYNYGTHFLYQGHEAGVHGALTRINLDADGAHRVTLMADTLADGTVLPNIDGITWDPFGARLLLTGEEGGFTGVGSGVVLQATNNYPSQVERLDGVFGIAGWEGVQVDSVGNVWLVSDQGGTTSSTIRSARQPNSFVYRFVPANPTDLKLGGKLQALQVMNLAGTAPIVFHAGQVDADVLSQDVRDLHSYGNRFATRWVTIHDTAKDGFAPFNAATAAKQGLATPFKRPENGVFRPGTDNRFSEFYFTETGDTNLNTGAGQAFGGFGAVFRLAQNGPSADTGVLSALFVGDAAHTGFDNIAFLTNRQVAVVEDAGDTLHTQRVALDSAYLLDVTADYGNPANQPLRFIAEGRDASATLDATTAGLNFNGDNEITGIHVSDGDPSVRGLLGVKAPKPFEDGWRVFWTQQHGDNNTWEIVPVASHRDED
jgi:hypothetical protein